MTIAKYISCQILADMKKVHDDFIIIYLYYFNIVMWKLWKCSSDREKLLKCHSASFQSGKHDLEMVFCYQNCSDLLWEKNFEVEGGEIAKFLRTLEQFIWTVKQCLVTE